MTPAANTEDDAPRGTATGTRERILQVSLRLFSEQGYDGTSLREIADELGVTKAALYYHFRTKEDILRSLMSTLQDELRALADWADAQPPGSETREALLNRAVDLALGPVSRVMEMAQRNQTALREIRSEHEGGRPPVEQLERIIAPLIPPDAGYEATVRARTAVFSIIAGVFLGRAFGDDAEPAERREVALRIARSVLGPEPAPGVTPE